MQKNNQQQNDQNPYPQVPYNGQQQQQGHYMSNNQYNGREQNELLQSYNQPQPQPKFLHDRQPIFNDQQYNTQNNPPVMTNFGNPMMDDEVPIIADDEVAIIVDDQVQINQNTNANTLQAYPSVPTKRFCQKLKCGKCNTVVTSGVKFFTGTGAWIAGFGMFLIFLWPCCCIPCYRHQCQDVYHYCPECKTLMGVKKYLID